MTRLSRRNFLKKTGIGSAILGLAAANAKAARGWRMRYGCQRNKLDRQLLRFPDHAEQREKRGTGKGCEGKSDNLHGGFSFIGG